MNQAGKVAVIVNPVAGNGRPPDLVEHFRERVLAAGGRCEVLVSGCPDDLHRFARELATEDTLIALAGGDGTIHNALPGLIGRPNPVLILPLGTENLLAKQLGISADFEALWSLFTSGRAAPFDVAMLNQQPFATVAGGGFDAEAVAKLAGVRRGHITHFDYFWPLWETFCQYRFPAVRVIADGEEISNEPALVFVGNIPRYAIGLQILRQARWDDGLLDLCVFGCNHRGHLMAHAFWTLLNWHVEHPRVTYRQVRHVRLESDEPLPLQSDGEPAGHLPAEITIRPASVNLIVPPETAETTTQSNPSGERL